MKIDFFAEICCDMCNDVVHNHFDCPACKTEYAGTDAYGEIDGDYYNQVSCQECEATFKLIKKEGFNRDDWDWEQVSED